MRYGRRTLRCTLVLAVLLAGAGTASQAAAQSIQRSVTTRNVSIETVVQFGANVQPVTIEESSRINIARVIQFGGTGTVDATIVQTVSAKGYDGFAMALVK